MKNTLFNKHCFEKYLEEITITQDQKDALDFWKKKLDNGDLKKEKSNYSNFDNTILQGVLGYDYQQNILQEDPEETGSGRSEFKLRLNENSKPFMIIELKGSKSNLDKSRNNKHETPVDQVFRYGSRNENTPWLLLSNYNEFRLYNSSKGVKKYVSFTVDELITNENSLKKFILLLSKTSYKKDIVNEIDKKSHTIEKEFNNDFYNLFAETRLMLIQDLKESSSITNEDAIYYAQLILDRIIFICFAEDKRLLPIETIYDAIYTPIEHMNIQERCIWNELNNLFGFINLGNSHKKIPEYNGGLFKENLNNKLMIQDTIQNPESYYENSTKKYNFNVDEKIEDKLTEYKINPIYKNILLLANFDFNTEVDVNILGHIFEHSINDLEDLKDNENNQKKNDGIYYTPPEITEYICKETIISALSKTGKSVDIPELLTEYKNDLNTLDTKLREIKILDPACGSGAFLNKAVDVLLEIHQSVFYSKWYGKQSKLYTTESKLNTIRFEDMTVRKEILLNNIYGVDLNKASVEITKLALFLKICKKNEKLPSLDNNIKYGDSIINSKEFAGDTSFDWSNEFKEIMENGGFDVVIGNPPYIRHEKIDDNLKPYIKENYDVYHGRADIYVYFFEKGISLLKENGYLGYICSNKWIKTEYGKNLRKYILNHMNILRYNDYTGKKIFEDATVDVSTIILKKDNSESINEILINDKEYLNQQKLTDGPWILNNKLLTLNEKILSKGTPIKEIKDITIHGGIKTAYNEAFIINQDVKNDLIKKDPSNENIINPVLKGEDIIKWGINDSYGYLITTKDGIDVKKDYPTIYDYLNKEEFKPDIEERKDQGSHWTNLRPCTYYNEFEKPKIVWQDIADKHPQVMLDKNNFYLEATTFMLTSKTVNLSYLTSLLNSNLFFCVMKNITPGLSKMGARYKIGYIKQLPIIILKKNQQNVFDEDVQNCQIYRKKVTEEIESFESWINDEYGLSKLPEKVMNSYYKYSFNDFNKEIKKKYKTKFNHNTYNNLKESFNESVLKIEDNLNKIEDLENKMNTKIYELYDLDSNEIKIIEDELKN